MDQDRREHAVVIGASMAGLVTARVLSQHFERVTLVERDELPAGYEHRRGVPQGHHLHGLLAGGHQVLEHYFPGLTDELLSSGAILMERPDQVYWEVLGHLMKFGEGAPPGVLVSRPFLEGVVRSRVRALPGVSIRERCSVLAPHVPDGTRVEGVVVMPVDGGAEETIAADLVVDASGRAGRMLSWLERMGYDSPATEEVSVRLHYLSERVRLAEDCGVADFTLVGPRPDIPMGFGMDKVEDGTWVVTVAGMAEADPGATREGLLATLAATAPAHVTEAVAQGEPVAEPVRFGYPASRRRRYEKLRRFPEGVLVIGDAICSFNPIYGQGMSVAALEAQALDAALARGDRDLARRFFRAAGRIVSVAWQLSVGSDLALPQVPGPRTPAVRMTNAWVERILEAAETDTEVTLAFMRVVALLDPPTALFRPGLARRVLRARRSDVARDQVGAEVERAEVVV